MGYPGGDEDLDLKCGLCGNAELGEVGAAGKVMGCPEEPSAEEVARHFAMGHPHFQAWCPHCVRGRGESAPHRRGDGEAGGIPQLCLDYMTMGDREEDKLGSEKGEQTKDVGTPIIVYKLKPAGWFGAHAVPEKGEITTQQRGCHRI